MKRFYIYKNEFNINNIVLSGVEHNHLKNVLRLEVGQHVIIVCADGYDYECEINDIAKNHTRLTLVNKCRNVFDSAQDVTFYQALTKSDNMNLIVQKLTELGVKTFIPFESRYTTAKDKLGKADKLQNISNQSIKQCKRSTPMQVRETHTFKQMVSELKNYDIVIFANECEKSTPLSRLNITSGKKVALIVGSEGGFDENEIAEIQSAGGTSVTLGKRILRAETSAIALASVVMYLMGEWTYD